MNPVEDIMVQIHVAKRCLELYQDHSFAFDITSALEALVTASALAKVLKDEQDRVQDAYDVHAEQVYDRRQGKC